MRWIPISQSPLLRHGRQTRIYLPWCYNISVLAPWHGRWWLECVAMMDQSSPEGSRRSDFKLTLLKRPARPHLACPMHLLGEVVPVCELILDERLAAVNGRH